MEIKEVGFAVPIPSQKKNNSNQLFLISIYHKYGLDKRKGTWEEIYSVYPEISGEIITEETEYIFKSWEEWDLNRTRKINISFYSESEENKDIENLI